MQPHRDFNDLTEHSARFVEVHNAEHHYSTMYGKTPVDLSQDTCIPLNPLRLDYMVDERPPIDSYNLNEITFIRLVRSDCIINVLNTEIRVDQSLMHTYVEATVCINDHRIVICQDGKLKQIAEFAMPVI